MAQGPETDAGDAAPPSRLTRLRRALFGAPLRLDDSGVYHSLALVPFLAWVGLGADGLSSSSYGPEEAFRTLGEHRYLAVGLALLTGVTVMLISAAYSKIIEEFPHGGGGYMVATKLLGERIGVVSGCALLVDYMLTITVSIACAGDALFSFLPPGWVALKLPGQILLIAGLTGINIRGVRESVTSMMPVFLLFLATHVLLIVGGILVRAPEAVHVASELHRDFTAGLSTLGLGPMALLFVHAYSLGGGTYTGIEAVSNGLQIMRAPRVQTAKRTMVYMAVSLAATAAGLLVCYLLWAVDMVPGKTLNAVLAERLTAHIPGGHVFVILTLLSEGALLVVAAQAGFIDGPRVLANMAVDSWVPRRFAALSERLTTQNGIMLMGGASLAALLYTGGNVRTLVVMYSINVFVTFSLSMFAMAQHTWRIRAQRPDWGSRLALFSVSFVFCATILVITVLEKFTEGGWVTLTATALVILLCYAIRGHYRRTGRKIQALYRELKGVIRLGDDADVPAMLDHQKPTAAVLVGQYGGLGIHTFLNIFRTFPGHFKNVVFLSVAVIDSGEFKGVHAVEKLEHRTTEMLRKYVALARGLKVPAEYRVAVGTDAIVEAEKLCRGLAHEFAQVSFFAGKVVFERESLFHVLLHNETAHALQKRLQWDGLMMVIMPARVSG